MWCSLEECPRFRPATARVFNKGPAYQATFMNCLASSLLPCTPRKYHFYNIGNSLQYHEGQDTDLMDQGIQDYCDKGNNHFAESQQSGTRPGITYC